MSEIVPAPARTPWQTATITCIVRQTPRVTSFYLKPSLPFHYRAGQHVDVRLTAPDGYRAQRSYSIASAPENGGVFELAIERLSDGEVSSFFHDVASDGDEIELRGPLGGHFVWSVADGGPLFLIGGGSGVVPLMSMLRHRAANASPVPAVLLFSARSWDEVIFRDELLALHEKHDGFQLVLTLTREASRREGDYARRIDRMLIEEVLAKFPTTPEQVLICGNNPFAETASRVVFEAGISASSIKTERYGAA
ncbi:MAG: ferredoxin reductase [Xanthobacteraceae bacterium]|nr:ferredoxin reductase [Xanthobacteraceae bacterium]